MACTEMLCACSSCVPTERNANQVSRLVCKNQSNFTHIVNMNVKRQALGRKAKDRLPRDRKKNEPPTVLVQKKADSRRKSLPKDKSEHYRYRIVFLSETTAYKCYGCDSAMRCPPAVPESPENIALTTMEHRSFSSDGKLQVKFQRAYYHVICHPIQKCFYWTSNFCR